MPEFIAWSAGIGGLALGLAAAFVPGFPGCAVALLGLVAFAGLTGFEVLTREALVLGALITAAGAIGQLAGPVIASRAVSGSAGAATGAALGAALGALVPVPGFSWGAALVGALILGAALSREGVVSWMRGVLGATGGCCVSALADVVAVLALGGLLGVAEYLSQLKL